MKNYSPLLFAVMLCASLTNGQEQSKFTLAEAEEYAVAHSYKVTNATLGMDIAQKKIWETTAMGLPQVNVQGNFQNLLYRPTSVVDATLFNPAAPPGSILAFQMGQKYNTSATLNVNQLLFDGSYIVGLQFSKFYKQMSQTQVELTKQQVKQMTREAFYQLVVAKKNLQLLDSLIPVTEQIWKQMQIMLDVGVSGSEPADQMELAYNGIKSSQASAARHVEIAISLLKLQMGYDQEKSIEISATFEEVLAAVTASAVTGNELSVKSNSNFVLLEQQHIANEYSLKNQKATLYPSLGAFFMHSQNAYRNQFNFFNNQDWYPSTVWGINLSVPVTTSGMKMARISQAEIKLDEDENNLADLENNLEFSAFRIRLSIQDALAMMKTEEANVQLARKIYENAIKREEVGTASAILVTQLQSQALTAQGSYIAAVMQLFQLQLELDKLYNQ